MVIHDYYSCSDNSDWEGNFNYCDDEPYEFLISDYKTPDCENCRGARILKCFNVLERMGIRVTEVRMLDKLSKKAVKTPEMISYFKSAF